MSPSRPDSESILRPGQTCWRASMAEQATLLIDGQEYFAALRATLLRARKLILIAGWDIDSRVHLPISDDASGEALTAPTQLGELLGYLVRTRPGLQVHVTRWNYHWFYRDDREPDTREQLEARGVLFYEDAQHPTTGCVHHKVVVVDDSIAFVGGIDLTHNRWDTRDHSSDDPRRRNEDGTSYMPVHDTQLCVSGPVVTDIAAYLRENWPGGGAPAAVHVNDECWPKAVPVHFRRINVGVCRTLPAPPCTEPVREVEAFYLAAIGRTERSLYLENQYFTCTHIAEAIAKRCREAPALQGLLVGMERPKTAAELHTMGHGMQRFHRVLADSGVTERVPLVAALSGGEGINLHSKLGLFDDRWLTVGSANLNRRSMGFDVECNLVLEATTAEHRQRMAELRNELLAEHLQMTPSAIDQMVRTDGLARLPTLACGQRRLIRLRPETLAAHLGPLLVPLFDRDCHWIPPPTARTKPRGSFAQRAVIVLLALTAGGWWGEVPALQSLTKSVSTVIEELQAEAALSLRSLEPRPQPDARQPQPSATASAHGPETPQSR
ncbi:MAG TPA: phospholipase D-like domain-containing protein [Steroidobacter sp.]|uniref:phospholipase D-like domain-containing protein n=1 Tax=Steroidobacter sp. TaxID=1978227 RepID=UPI002ED8BAD4